MADPLDVIAKLLYDGDHPVERVFVDAEHFLAALAAAGWRVVPEDRPASETNPQVIVDFVVEEVLLPLGGCVADRSYTGPELMLLLDDLRNHVLELRTVVPEDRPAPCPHCNDDGVVHTYDGIVLGPCDCPAGVPALDDDTRREVEGLVAELNGSPGMASTSRVRHLQISQVRRAAELLAAAYLGGTDGR